MDDELLDLVDQNDQKIGTINRKDYGRLIEQKLGFIRAAELFVMNDSGELWIPVRAATKTIAPNGYDYSAAGHVTAGDDYLTTVVREAKEETNLALAPKDIEFVAKLKSRHTRYIRSVYLTHSNSMPWFNPEDFVGAEWLKPSELIKRIDDGHPAKSNLRETVRVLQEYIGDY